MQLSLLGGEYIDTKNYCNSNLYDNYFGEKCWKRKNQQKNDDFSFFGHGFKLDFINNQTACKPRSYIFFFFRDYWWRIYGDEDYLVAFETDF